MKLLYSAFVKFSQTSAAFICLSLRLSVVVDAVAAVANSVAVVVAVASMGLP